MEYYAAVSVLVDSKDAAVDGGRRLQELKTRSEIHPNIRLLATASEYGLRWDE
jgi:hypothetical protein